MRFWDWAVGAYARPGVTDACLALQDRHGQSPPYLLWAAWAALTGRSLSAPELAEGADLAARWDALATAPLRQTRRDLKAPFTGMDEAARLDVRERIKAVELQAEQALMNALEALAPAHDHAEHPLAEAIDAACAAWGRPAPKDVLNQLMQNLA